MLTIEKVKEIVQEIENKRLDNEMAHILEDNLYHLVLQSIFENDIEDIRCCVYEALKTQNIEFCRWHA